MPLWHLKKREQKLIILLLKKILLHLTSEFPLYSNLSGLFWSSTVFSLVENPRLKCLCFNHTANCEGNTEKYVLLTTISNKSLFTWKGFCFPPKNNVNSQFGHHKLKFYPRKPRLDGGPWPPSSWGPAAGLLREPGSWELGAGSLPQSQGTGQSILLTPHHSSWQLFPRLPRLQHNLRKPPTPPLAYSPSL